ncbi:amine oxidase [Panus rudis PR-1116 ss-1]|nr:amine oxidase [Panus rudis PR-1116 ss-1]
MVTFLPGVALALAFTPWSSYGRTVEHPQSSKNATVLILGGGVSGVIAARSLHQQGITDFKIVDALDEIGGRLQSFKFGVPGNQRIIELGPNWVQGTETPGGPQNPIWSLVQKYNVKTQVNDFVGSMATYDKSGPMDYLDVFGRSIDAFNNLTVVAGNRASKRLVDISSRTGYALLGMKPRTPQDFACEYFNLDWESGKFDYPIGDTAEKSSMLATSWAANFTYDEDVGGFGDDNALSIDQRGFKTFIQAEAETFLRPEQVHLNSTVKTIAYSSSGVEVTLTTGEKLTADHALVTFSIGVLQNDDVKFSPPLPEWKQEAIQGMTMADQTTYTKIFLQFPRKFWFDTEMALYADPVRGTYPVWQSLDHDKFFPGSHILFVTVTGDYSVRVETLSDVEVQAEVMKVIRTMFPNITVPEPVGFHFPRWHQNPLFRGSYSNWPPDYFNGHHQNLRATVDNRLWFAGEGNSQKYFGFLHGAYFEGMRTATAMAKCIKGNGCADLKHVEEVKNADPYVIS